MIVIDSFIDLVVDYNLIFFVPNMQENTPFVPTLGLSHKVFAVLNGSEEDAESGTEVRKCLNKNGITISATAADFCYSNVT